MATEKKPAAAKKAAPKKDEPKKAAAAPKKTAAAPKKAAAAPKKEAAPKKAAAPKKEAAKPAAHADHGGNVTTDHDEIRKWVEERGGRPSTVKSTHKGEEAGILRIDFPDGPEPALEEIDWDAFFEKFEEKKLAFLHQDTTAGGKQSRFNKFISR